MNMQPICEVQISAVLYQEDGQWVAQGLEYDITARGKTPADASDKFTVKVGAELVMSYELNDESPLSAVAPAPQKFWRMFEAARMRVDIDETPIRITDGGSASRVRPRLKIGELVAA